MARSTRDEVSDAGGSVGADIQRSLAAALLSGKNPDGTDYTLPVSSSGGASSGTVQDANAATTTGSDVQLVQHVNNDGTKTLDVNVVSGGGGGDVAITPYTSGAVASVSVTDTVSTILAGSVLGRRIVFQNRDATNPVYIGPTGSVTVANSIKVAAGASYESDDTNFAWRGITDTGITVDVAIVTFTR